MERDELSADCCRGPVAGGRESLVCLVVGGRSRLRSGFAMTVETANPAPAVRFRK